MVRSVAPVPSYAMVVTTLVVALEVPAPTQAAGVAGGAVPVSVQLAMVFAARPRILGIVRMVLPEGSSTAMVVPVAS